MPATLCYFEADDRPLPAPLIPASAELRERLIWREGAVMRFLTPERIAACLESGEWPSDVVALVADERDELEAHVDGILAIVEQG